MAEMHLVSFETPLAAAIREELYKRPEVSDKLFGTTTLGALLQFNPSLRWIEEEHGELIITAKTGIPLVRYNSHDLGGVMGFSELLGKLSDEGIVVGDLLNKLNLTLEDAWKWPFFFCHGRGNSVSLMGANIYPANVEKFFQSHHIIHDYKLEVIHSEEQEPRLAVHVELRKNSSVTQLEEKIFCEMAETEILELLLQNNADYADAYSEEPSAMSPLVILYTYSAGPFEQKQMKQHHIVH
jgi:phenylacetate-CoA ligase